MPAAMKLNRKDLIPLYHELIRQRERVAQDMQTEYEEIEASELSDGWIWLQPPLALSSPSSLMVIRMRSS
jgi:hypothetical protein